MNLRFLACCIALLGSIATTIVAEEPKPSIHAFHYDQLLGTSVELRIACTSPEVAVAAERTALAEIERLSGILSSYDAKSEFSRWSQQAQGFQKVSPELFEALFAADHWRNESNGAFSASAEVVCRLWKAAARTGQLPSADLKRSAAELAAKSGWKLDSKNQSASRIENTPITLNALAEGLIADHVARKTIEGHPQIAGLLINIGGDIRISGDFSQNVAIANPAHPSENGRPVCRVHLQNQSIVTSGGYRKGVEIAGKWYSHIVDPRTGEPTGHIHSASVIATTTTDADALATILCVLSIDEGLKLIAKQNGAECLIVDADGNLHRSAGWSEYEAPGEQGAFTSAPLAEDGSKFELEIDLEINKPTAARGYRRPYVAVWLEDKDNLPIRTIAVWTQLGGKGARWLPDLKKWYKSDQLRKLADGTEIIDTVSSATKAPGKYKLTWDGLDDAGKPVKPGKYTLFIEAAREHGTYQVIRSQHEFDGKPFKAELKGNEEIKGATLDYRQPAATGK